MSEHHRPRFHVRTATGWINDPNAPIQVDGRYHLFCQHNPGAAEHGEIHWAHFSSADLVHWTTHPIALRPRAGGPDADGCWSGSAVVVDGELLLLYSGKVGAAEVLPVCLAHPSPSGEQWVADAEPVMAEPPESGDLAMFRDPFLWVTADGFRMLVGAGYRDGTGAALLYQSSDLRSWEPLGPLCTAAHPAFDAYDTGDGWECPQLVRQGGRGVLVLSIWRQPGLTDHVAFVSGALNGDRLTPEVVGRFDHGPDFYAPALTVDGDGRCLLWGWSWEARNQALADADGWAGVLTAPRLVVIAADGTPRMVPAPEVAALRGASHSADLILAPGERRMLDETAGRCLDLEVRLVPGSDGRAWVRLLAHSDGTEHTEVGVDAATHEVYLSRDRSSSDPGSYGGTYRMPVDLDAGGGVDLRVLLDASIVEVFAGDGHAMTARVYPRSRDSIGLYAGVDSTPGGVDVRWWTIETAGRITAPET